MIALYDHIQELRAELQSCHLTRRERAEAEAELARAIAQQELAQRLEEIACELHMAYRNPASGTDNIVTALTLLDILQAEID